MLTLLKFPFSTFVSCQKHNNYSKPGLCNKCLGIVYLLELFLILRHRTCAIPPSGSFICDFSYFSTRVSHMLWNTVMQIIRYYFTFGSTYYSKSLRKSIKLFIWSGVEKNSVLDNNAENAFVFYISKTITKVLGVYSLMVILQQKTNRRGDLGIKWSHFNL